MRAIKPFAEILDVGNNIDVLKKIEMVGRTCYKSTEKITDDSAPKFVSNLIKCNHEAMLEHGSFCFEIDRTVYNWMKNSIEILSSQYNFHSFIRFTNDRRILMSGNIRAWRDFFRNIIEWIGIPATFEDFIYENPILFPEYQDEIYIGKIGSIRQVNLDTIYTINEFLTHCDVTVRFVVDRGVSHELVRHRPASFAQESTRYCNYSKDKFGNQLTFIIPEFFQYDSYEWNLWANAMRASEADYLKLIECGVTPEKARTVLPNSLKTEVIMTANCAEWRHFFNLRACNSTGKAHPQMLEVTRPLLDDFKNYIPIIFGDLVYGQ